MNTKGSAVDFCPKEKDLTASSLKLAVYGSVLKEQWDLPGSSLQYCACAWHWYASWDEGDEFGKSQTDMHNAGYQM